MAAFSLDAYGALLLLTVAALPIIFYLLLLPGRNRPASPERGNGMKPPPSPLGLPLLGHLHLLGSLPHRSLVSLARAHGPVMLLRFGRKPTVVVSSAKAAEEVMRTRDVAFASRAPVPVADRLLYGCDVAFAPYGEYWRQARRVCVVHLLSPLRVLSFRRVREDEAAALVARVRSRAAAVDLGGLLSAYANAVVGRAAFGDESARGLYQDDGGSRGHEVRKALFQFQKLLGAPPLGELLPWLGWVDALRGREGKITRTFQALDGLLDKVIEEHRLRSRGDDDDDDRRDFVDVLLDVQKNDKEHGALFGTNEIKAIILDMIAAGTDTTTTAMEWAMAELVTHPRAMRKLQEEIRTAVDAAGGAVTEDAISGLPYLNAVAKETLRLHPSVPLLVPRESTTDSEILGYRVPARTRVMINAWAIGRDAATWEDAEEFMPERFLGGSAAAGVDYKGKDMALVPFGAGRRGCSGIGFAEASMHMALASLHYHFDWEADGGGGGPSALDMTEVSGLTVHIKAGLPLVAKPRIP